LVPITCDKGIAIWSPAKEFWNSIKSLGRRAAGSGFFEQAEAVSVPNGTAPSSCLLPPDMGSGAEE
jgi:hypothetical protein